MLQLGKSMNSERRLGEKLTCQVPWGNLCTGYRRDPCQKRRDDDPCDGFRYRPTILMLELINCPASDSELAISSSDVLVLSR